MRTTAAAAVAQSLACLGETYDGAVCGQPRQKSLEAEGREAEGSRLIVQFGGVDLRIVNPFRGGSTVGMTGTRGGKSARICTKPFGSLLGRRFVSCMDFRGGQDPLFLLYLGRLLSARGKKTMRDLGVILYSTYCIHKIFDRTHRGFRPA